MRPFLSVPPNQVLAQENTTKEIVWQIKHCGWAVKIATENDTLYPNLTSPVSHADYNVTITPGPYICEGNESDVNTTVVLSIVFNKNVLTVVDSIYCIVYMESNRTLRYNSSTDLAIATIPPTTTMISESTIYNTSTCTSSIETATDSGCRLCVHFSSLVLCLLVATLAFSLISCH